jgi:hypothetical protein
LPPRSFPHASTAPNAAKAQRHRAQQLLEKEVTATLASVCATDASANNREGFLRRLRDAKKPYLFQVDRELDRGTRRVGESRRED